MPEQTSSVHKNAQVPCNGEDEDEGLPAGVHYYVPIVSQPLTQ